MKISILLLVLFSMSCARSPLKDVRNNMRAAKPPKEIKDDLDMKKLRDGLEVNINYLKKKKELYKEIAFGPRVVSNEDYVEAVESLIKAYDGGGKESFIEFTKNHFEYFEVYGQKKWGDVFMTSYFEPEIKASKKKTKEHTQPLYSTPKDMVVIKLGEFAKVNSNFTIKKDIVFEQKSSHPVLRGRLVENKDSMSTVVPYHTREDIDVEKKITDKSLIIAWVDPLDSFFLQIQGSGTLSFDDGKKMQVGYAAQNGHSYVAIGRFLLDQIPLEEMSMQKIEAYLRSLPPEQMQEILSYNPSYVFFQKLEGRGLTYFGTEVIEGRTIATDKGLFPKGVIAYLEYEKPTFKEEGEPIVWEPSSRFVIDQDTGGAIRGAGRLDLFWGMGDEAKKVAGHMKNRGRLYYLVPREEFIAKLIANRLKTLDQSK